MHFNAGDVGSRRRVIRWSDGAGGRQVSRDERDAWREEFAGEGPSKGGNMSEATHEQVNLMLKLYELRREPKLREARDWFGANFHVQTAEDVMRLCPPGSKENVYMRMVLGYWEMVASIVNRGLVDEDLFFENSGEQWMVWEQVKPVLGAWRTMFGSQKVFRNMEEHAKRLEAWREKHSPGSNEAMRKTRAEMTARAQAPKAQAASN
jgi:hypothetical protein